MRVLFTVADRTSSQTLDLLLDAEADTPISDVATALSERLRGPSIPGGSAPTPTLFLAGNAIRADHTLAVSGIVDGALVSLDDPTIGIGAEPGGLVEIRVVAGPGAGQVLRLGVGEISIGSDPTCSIRLDGPNVRPVEARLLVQLDGTVRLRGARHTGQPAGSLGKSEGKSTRRGRRGEPLQQRRQWQDADDEARPISSPHPLLDGEAIDADEVAWSVGAELQVAGNLLELHDPTGPDQELMLPSNEGWLDYNRPPRMRPPIRRTKFRLPTPPSAGNRAGLPIIGALAPAALGCVMAIVMKQPQYLIMAAMTPMMLVANSVSSRRQGKKTQRQQLREYREHLTAIDEETAAALVAERRARRDADPDAAQLLLTATGPRARLWERRRGDEDHLRLRLGTADLPSEVMVDDPERMEHKREVQRIARDVPVAISLREVGVLGVASAGPIGHSLVNWFIGQLAVQQSPRDVQCYVLTDSAAETTWRWAAWLPHLRPAMGQDALSLIGTDAESLGRRVAELNQLVAERRKAAIERSGTATFDAADIVVVLDGARRLRALPGIVSLLKDGPALGVYCICLDSTERLLPEECRAVVVDEPQGLVLRQQLARDITPIRPDLLPAAWYQRVGRALSPIRDVSDEGEASAIPNSSRLLDVLNLDPPTGESIAARWLISGASTRAVVGESLDGAFAIDLRRDGPHGLIAGTTGSGKSELLQTIVASLAVANRPDAMTFVLVDYKGGAAFKDCVDLPHTVGMVTDLDTHLVERALTSLGAELTRREHILAGAGAKDIEDYADYATRDTRLAPLPRLLIVIDEFASMARELPDFVTGLVNIAQRGRSLGIHLILATQRPTGVVSPEIRANTNLRIALRVTDPAESADVIDAPDAARISKATPGRAYVRLGHSSLVPFQSGRVGGRQPGSSGASTRRPPFTASVGWASFGQPQPQPPKPVEVDSLEVTDLAVLVRAVREATTRAGVTRQHSPWLEALPDLLDIEAVLADVRPGEPTTEDQEIAPIPFGFADIPAEQARRVTSLDLTTFGHLYIIGSPRSGRSQALRTIAAMTAQVTSSADVHIFGIDCGNGALIPLSKLPHCGAVVQRTQSERAQRLIGRLRSEVMRRQELLGAGGFADITEQRNGVPVEERLPHLLVLLDRWEGFTGSLGEIDGGALGDQIMLILREGASVGVHMVMTGDRSLLSGRMTTLTEDKLLLRLADRGDYSLAGLNPRKLPDDPTQGRAFRSESGIETQIAVLGSDPGGPAQAAEILRIAELARARDSDVPRARRPFRVDVLPSLLPFDDAWGMREDEKPRPLWGLVGVGGDELLAVGADLAAGPPTFVIGGPPKSGRSGLLETMTRSILRGGGEVVIAAPRPSPMRALVDTPGVRAVLTETSLTEDVLAPLMADGPVALMIDDAELLKDIEAKDWLRDLLRTAGDKGKAVVIAGNADDICSGFTGWQLDLKKNRCGALLSPQGIMDGDLLGIRLPRSSIGNQVQPGRALVHLGDGELLTVQVPVIS